MRPIKDILSNNYICLTQDKTLNNLYQGCYATDLLSAAIKSADDHAILITLISHDNTVGCAMMIDLPAIIITENRVVTKQMIDKCNEEGICLIQTTFKNHEVIIDLYQRGLI